MLYEIIISKKKQHKKDSSQISLCGHLEAIVGQYCLYGAGVSDIETLYYDPSAGLYDAIELAKDRIAAFFVNNEHVAFVRKDMLTKILSDTEGFNITFIPVDNFADECLTRNDLERVSEYFTHWEAITWIDDDFMNDANKEFDFAAFEIIDSGARYLNPGHFSVEQLVSFLKALEM